MTNPRGGVSASGAEHFRLAVEAAPNSMIVVQREGKIVLVNSQTEKIFGYKREELVGQKIEILIPHRFRGGHPALRRSFNAAPRSRPMGAGRDLFGLRKDGSEMPVEIGLSPIDPEEGLIVVSIVDITQRKKAEELSKEITRAEAAKKELEAFSYSVAHDLRAPLRHIDGFIQILQRRAADTLDARNRELLDKVSRAAKKMGVLIDELLAFSKTAAAEIQKAPVSLQAVVAGVIADSKEETLSRHVEWKLGPLPKADCDAGMIKIVLSNLIGNALKFTRAREQPVIEIGALSERPHEVVVFVRDNGAGFDMKFVDKLFGVFQRLHPLADFDGTGIGLAHVRRIIAKHGGRTWAEGAVDKGATFYFSLPVKTEDTA